MTEVRKDKTLEEVLANTGLFGDCMLWKGGRHQQNYGMMRQRGEMRSCHSVVAELKYGYKPDKYHGERVTRTCNNNLCIAPDHIIIEKTANIKRARYICKNRKLTQEQARDIRKRVAEGDHTTTGTLAEEYNISKNMVYGIKYNRMYKERDDD